MLWLSHFPGRNDRLPSLDPRVHSVYVCGKSRHSQRIYKSPISSQGTTPLTVIVIDRLRTGSVAGGHWAATVALRAITVIVRIHKPIDADVTHVGTGVGLSRSYPKSAIMICCVLFFYFFLKFDIDLGVICTRKDRLVRNRLCCSGAEAPSRQRWAWPQLLRYLCPGLICEGRLRGSGLAHTRAVFGFVVADGHGLGVECHGAVSEGSACGGVGSADSALGHAVRGRPADRTGESGLGRGGPCFVAPCSSCCLKRAADGRVVLALEAHVRCIFECVCLCAHIARAELVRCAAALAATGGARRSRYWWKAWLFLGLELPGVPHQAPNALPCLRYTPPLSGGTFPAGERGGAAGRSLLSSHCPDYT
jgi:hypothetical protein